MWTTCKRNIALYLCLLSWQCEAGLLFKGAMLLQNKQRKSAFYPGPEQGRRLALATTKAGCSGGIKPENPDVRQWWEERSSAEFAHRSLGGYLQGKDAVVATWEKHFLKRFDWKGKKVLDYGIGGGYLGEALFSTYGLGSYVGMDISKKSLNVAFNNLAEEVDQGKVKLMLTPQNFSEFKPDILVCQAVIQHFPSVEYLDEFLANADASGASEMMLQIRYGNTTQDSAAYASINTGAQEEELKKVGRALLTNAEYLQSKLTRYKLTWSEGPLPTTQYLFTGWEKDQ